MIPPILITGAARSGTSLTAGIIQRCGAWGGEMSGSTPYNQRGMYENKTIRNEIVKPYLRDIGMDPMGQNPLPDRTILKPFPDLRDRVEGVFREHGYPGGPWFYKGAKMCLMWPLWAKAFPDAKWIIVRRKDEEIIESCMRTGFMRAYKDAEGWGGWLRHHLECFDEMLYHLGVNVFEIWSEWAVRGILEPIQDVVENIGLQWNEKDVREFIDPKLWSGKC